MDAIRVATRDAIVDGAQRLGDAVMKRHYAVQPELERRYSPREAALARRDTGYHLAYLAEAVACDAPELFAAYVGWAKVFLPQIGVPLRDLETSLECLRDTLADELPPGQAEAACAVVASGLARLPALPAELPCFLYPGAPHAALARAYLDALLAGDRRGATRLIVDAVETGAEVADVYEHVFQPCQHEIGRLWQTSRISVAQEHFCTAATQLAMSLLYPRTFSRERCGRTVVAACIGGDLHEVGLRMVSDFFEMAGWDTVYLGASTPHAGVVTTLLERGADVLAVSSTMVFHLAQVRALVAAVRSHPRLAAVRVMVGGYPFNVAEGIWRSVGADLFAPDARTAVRVAETALET